MIQATPNTVADYPEHVFRAAWISIQWKAMLRAGKGYRRPPAPTRAQRAADEAREKQEAAPGAA